MTNAADPLLQLRKAHFALLRLIDDQQRSFIRDPAQHFPQQHFSVGPMQVDLSAAELTRIEDAIPAGAIAGTRYDEH